MVNVTICMYIHGSYMGYTLGYNYIAGKTRKPHIRMGWS